MKLQLCERITPKKNYKPCLFALNHKSTKMLICHNLCIMQCHSFLFHNIHNLIHLIPFTFHAVKFIYSQFPIFYDFLQITSFIGKRRRHISLCKHALPNYVLFSGIDFSPFFTLFFPPCIRVSKGGKPEKKEKVISFLIFFSGLLQ